MTLLDALDLQPLSRVALIGGGGKTTLMLQLAREARERGWPVTITTTTRLAATTRDPDLLAEPAEEGKLQGPGLAAIQQIRDRFVVVEADGSRGLPLKVHDDHEPVVPDGFKVVLVAGMSGLHRPAHQVVHRYELLGLEGVVDEEIFRMIALAYPADAIVLNQADDPEPARALGLPGPVVIRGCDVLERSP